MGSASTTGRSLRRSPRWHAGIESSPGTCAATARSQPVGAPFSIPLAVEDLRALLDRQGVERAAFVGHSAGSYVTQELAFRHPRCALALVLADGTCLTWPHGPVERWFTRHAAELLAPFPYRWIKLSSIPALAANPAVQDYVHEAYAPLSRAAFLGLVRGASTCLHEEPAYRIQQPLLLLHGDGELPRGHPEAGAEVGGPRAELPLPGRPRRPEPRDDGQPRVLYRRAARVPGEMGAHGRRVDASVNRALACAA